MIHTIPNAAIAYQNIVGIKTIWQNQIAHHVTELTARLNNRNNVDKTTWMKLKQAQLNLKSRKCILGLSIQILEQVSKIRRKSAAIQRKDRNYESTRKEA
ncbi:7270_t:CDS:2 [Racocetra persica]|uniref:7270_t:CDS:1 n=1 Tax=Racocetra persica TaxID=160502 RepID=A0ACA9KJZ4_9GLOM|nr:7270_t:CDS:2 [Racocetra persica]